MSNDERVIRIRLDISIPSNGQAIQVDTGATPVAALPSGAPPAAQAQPVQAQAAPFGGPPKWGPLGVTLPPANTDYSVRTCAGSGNRGDFYSAGDCVGISPTPDEVRLQCNGGTAVVANMDAAGSWYHDAVPGAVCSSDPSSYPLNELLVTFLRGGGTITSTTVLFYGKCVSSCGDEAAQAATANRFLPTSYLVRADGFSQALAHFNGQWTLRVCPCGAGDAEVRWQAALPAAAGSIELLGRPACGSAQLVFRDTAHEVRYEKPQGSWHPMNVADFADCHSVAVPPGASLPAIVQVELA